MFTPGSMPSLHHRARLGGGCCHFDTAGAAREVAEADDPTVAALAPRLAAELYGLDILASDVEDGTTTTRFLVLAREPIEPPGR